MMKSRSSSKILGLLGMVLCLAVITGCTPVRKAEFINPPENTADSHPAPIKFTNVRVQIPMGQEIGMLRSGCYLRFQKVGQEILKDSINQESMDDTFADTLTRQGYDVVSRLTTDFEEDFEENLLRTEYKISAKIIDGDINACYDGSQIVLDRFILGASGYNGEMYLKIEWAVYDNLRREVIYKTTTEGYTKRKSFNLEGLSLMMNEAFAMAAHNLGGNAEFHDLIFNGKKPTSNRKVSTHAEDRPRIFDPNEIVTITNPPLSTKSITSNIENIRKIGVLIQAGAGHGSGFFIDTQGHIVTNAHVVGDAVRVRVVTAGKKQSLTAEVLRKDKIRDVALLRLEEKPPTLKTNPLPVRVEWPKVSEDIYALGAPQSTRLADTLTKGIVSAHRKNYKAFGASMDFIQGDVSIHGGNSGGALMDTYGNIIGISVAGYAMDEQQRNAGLNLFIPIEDALKRLDINLQ